MRVNFVGSGDGYRRAPWGPLLVPDRQRGRGPGPDPLRVAAAGCQPGRSSGSCFGRQGFRRIGGSGAPWGPLLSSERGSDLRQGSGLPWGLLLPGGVLWPLLGCLVMRCAGTDPLRIGSGGSCFGVRIGHVRQRGRLPARALGAAAGTGSAAGTGAGD